ncbi:MAG: GatB/YqeY domain-containing protein [Candidatus Manganitrophaceae bacterium]|nr:MAG: GatB/YqeY domain-containing protein [Candidatus Manganitrophaceae bacterium]
MTLQQRLVDEMKEAMRTGDANRLSVIRLLRSAIKNKEIDKGKGQQLTEEEILQVISTAVKQRKESIEQFEKGGRRDLVEKENSELTILQSFLPQQISDEELRIKIKEAIAQSGAADIKDMGKVMKLVVPQLVGRAEGSKISQMVRECLGQK